MKKVISKLLGHYFAWMPQSVAKCIYLLPYHLIRLSLAKTKCEVWYRHSVYFGDIQFGVSDLDLTVYSLEFLKKEEVLKIEEVINFWRIFFPFVGEVSYYDNSFLKKMTPYMNPLELGRDPILTKRISSYRECRPSLTQVFILNWLSSDCHKMRERFPWRQKKIRRFLGILGIDKGVRSLNELIVLLCDSFFPSQWHVFIKDFCSYDFRNKRAVNDFYSDFPEHRRLFMIAFPQMWIGASFHFHNFEEECDWLKEVSEEEKDLFLEQLNWEIFGLLGQWKREGEVTNLLIHCENLLRLLKSEKERGHLQIEGLRLLCNLQERELEVVHVS